MFVRTLVVIGVLVGGGALWSGLEYYVTPLQERPFSPLHDLYSPTGLIGHGLGIIGTLMILSGVVMYSLRKRVRMLSKVGSLKNWLHFHIFLCLLGPFLVLLHTTFKFGGIVAIAFWSMTLVVASGVFGRWVYVWIPKTVNGRFLAREEIRQGLTGLLDEVGEDRLSPQQRAAIQRATLPLLSHAAQEPPPGDRRTAPRPGRDRRRYPRHQLGLGAAVLQSVRHALTKRRTHRRVRQALGAAGVTGQIQADVIARLEDERRLELQLQLLEPFQRAFRYWHAFHLPLAAVMVLVLIVHVGVSVAFGYTWIF